MGRRAAITQAEPLRRTLKTATLDRAQRIKIAAEADCDERSVAAVYNGNPTRSVTRSRILRAAGVLGLPLPSAR